MAMAYMKCDGMNRITDMFIEMKDWKREILDLWLDFIKEVRLF